MTIDNCVQFMDLVCKYDLKQTNRLAEYYDGYLKVCSCKPTLKNLYFQNSETAYVEYVNSNIEHIKQKIGPFISNDPIIMFKSNNKIFCTLAFN